MNIIPILPAGTTVKLTKVSAFADSKVAVGHVLKGKLKNKITADECIRLQDGTKTSPVKNISMTSDADYIVVTATSLYFMQLL